MVEDKPVDVGQLQTVVVLPAGLDTLRPDPDEADDDVLQVGYGLPLAVQPAFDGDAGPGAVWPAMVRPEWRMVMLPWMTPLTAKTTIRGPLAAQASCRLPEPEGLSVVTLMTRPPRAPRALAPKPSAPGKAGGGSAACTNVQQTKAAKRGHFTLALVDGRRPRMDPRCPSCVT